MKIKFTGLEIDSTDLLEDTKFGNIRPWPKEWERLSLPISMWLNEGKLKKWLDENITYRYDFYSNISFDKQMVTLIFESDEDMVFFQLMDGLNISQSDDTN